jgi:hypothetical protein
MSKYVSSVRTLVCLGVFAAVLLAATTGCPPTKTPSDSKKTTTDNEKKTPTNPTEKEEKKLTVLPVGPIELKKGMTADVKVSIKREKFNEPVKIAFDNLPKGVTVESKDMAIAKDADHATFQLKAAADAELTAKDATVTATWGDLKAVSEGFKVTVKDAK